MYCWPSFPKRLRQVFSQSIGGADGGGGGEARIVTVPTQSAVNGAKTTSPLLAVVAPLNL